MGDSPRRESVETDDPAKSEQEKLKDESNKTIDPSFEKTGWAALEMTAENMNQVLANAGVIGVRIQQLYDYPSRSVSQEAYFHGLMLFYKWRPDRGKKVVWNPSKTPSMYGKNPLKFCEDDSGDMENSVIFCNQMISNASVTEALIVAMVNIEEREEYQFQLGSGLLELKRFIFPLDPALRTATIYESELVQKAHNDCAFKAQSTIASEQEQDMKSTDISLAEEFWHYILYLPGGKGRVVYELEGMAADPKVAGTLDPTIQSWTEVAVNALDIRISELRQHEAPFCMFGILDDIGGRDQSVVEEGFPEGNSVNSNAQIENNLSSRSSSPQPLKRRKHIEGVEINNIHSDLKFDKLTSAEERNILAHDYTTFLLEMMKLMASRGDVKAILRQAQEDGGSEAALSGEDFVIDDSGNQFSSQGLEGSEEELDAEGGSQSLTSDELQEKSHRHSGMREVYPSGDEESESDDVLNASPVAHPSDHAGEDSSQSDGTPLSTSRAGHKNRTTTAAESEDEGTSSDESSTGENS